MLAEIRAQDFCGYAEFKLVLHNQGLVWVSGENNDTKAADSNGAGKTTLFKAVTWALYGKTIDGDRSSDPGDKVIRKGTKRALVELDVEGGWCIRRERSKGSPRLALIQPDGKPWEGAGREEIQAKIIEMIGMDFAAFKNTVLYGQNDTARFAHPATTDAARKDMLHKLLRTTILAVCEKLARVKHREAKASLDARQADVDKICSRISEIDVASLRTRKQAWDAERTADADALETQAAGLAAQATSVMSAASSVTPLRARVAELQAQLDVAEAANDDNSAIEAKLELARKTLAQTERAMDRAAADRQKARETLESLKGDRCELCTSPLSTGAPAERIAHLRAEKSKASRAYEMAEADRNKTQAAIDGANAEMETAKRRVAKELELARTMRKVQSDLSEAEAAAEKARSLAQRARDRLAQRADVLAKENPHTEALATAKAKLKTLEAERDALAGRREESAQLMRELDFWVRGFGPQGLPSFVLDSVMPYITERANHYLEMLSDSDICMEFKTQRELKSDKGALRDELAITWVIEGIEDMAPSGGQGRKMEIATDLALMDLAEAREGAGLSVFMADEILDGLDAEGTERVMQLLQELRSRRSSVFVISHQASMHELFEKQLTVVKDGSVARLEAA